MLKTTLFILFAVSILKAADMPLTDYETVAASQTTQTLGPVGGAGDVLQRLIIVPATSTPGQVYINDGAGSSVIVHTGGVSLSDIKPFVVEVGARSASGVWCVS